MSSVTIVGVVVTFALAMCVLAFLKCFAFASSSGRHALGFPREDQLRSTEESVLGDVICVPVGPEMVIGYGVGLSVDDDYPSDFIGARPYLEEYWKRSGCHPAEQTAEFAAVTWADEDGEYQSVSGQLELVA